MSFSSFSQVLVVPPVIVLDDISHRPDGRQVFIHTLRTDVMQRLGRSGITVRAGKVHGNLTANVWVTEHQHQFKTFKISEAKTQNLQ